MRTTEYWQVGEDGELRSVVCHIPIWISASGSYPAFEVDDVVPSDRILITPVDPTSDLCAALLRPDQSKANVGVNGQRVAPGLHALHHGDRVTVDDRDIWIGVRVTPDQRAYDPDHDGDPVYCARTRVRLEPGAPMVLCRGTPRADCGLRFTTSAWATGIPCHNCGATDDGSTWSPPHPSGSDELEGLLRLVAGS